jgi:hypothetical protein
MSRIVAECWYCGADNCLFISAERLNPGERIPEGLNPAPIRAPKCVACRKSLWGATFRLRELPAVLRPYDLMESP